MESFESKSGTDEKKEERKMLKKSISLIQEQIDTTTDEKDLEKLNETLNHLKIQLESLTKPKQEDSLNDYQPAVDNLVFEYELIELRNKKIDLDNAYKEIQERDTVKNYFSSKKELPVLKDQINSLRLNIERIGLTDVEKSSVSDETFKKIIARLREDERKLETLEQEIKQQCEENPHIELVLAEMKAIEQEIKVADTKLQKLTTIYESDKRKRSLTEITSGPN